MGKRVCRKCDAFWTVEGSSHTQKQQNLCGTCAKQAAQKRRSRQRRHEARTGKVARQRGTAT